jgi:hypothetical protein
VILWELTGACNIIPLLLLIMIFLLATAMSSQIAARSCSGITAADNAALVSFQQSDNIEGEFPKC